MTPTSRIPRIPPSVVRRLRTGFAAVFILTGMLFTILELGVLCRLLAAAWKRTRA